jgi:hypothetical protein
MGVGVILDKIYCIFSNLTPHTQPHTPMGVGVILMKIYCIFSNLTRHPHMGAGAGAECDIREIILYFI